MVHFFDGLENKKEWEFRINYNLGTVTPGLPKPRCWSLFSAEIGYKSGVEQVPKVFKCLRSVKVRWKMHQRMTKLDEAKNFLEEASREFERGVKENNVTLVRDAGEKAWGAVVQATNDLFERRGLPIPTTHRERREYLEKLEEVDPIVREKGLTDRFMARDHVLHERCFYEGYCNIDELRKEFEKVKRYIDDIEKL